MFFTCTVCTSSFHSLFTLLFRMLTDRIIKTSMYLQHFEESINRKNKFSIEATDEFCLRPDSLLDRDIGLISMTQQLQGLDEICGSTAKRFMQFESEYAWRPQPVRRKNLIKLLKRYNNVPQISELTNIEEDLSWSDFCSWFANRNKLTNKLELEFSDFVEDQREKEGRLFYRWHKSLFRAKEMQDLAAAEAQEPNAGSNKSTNNIVNKSVLPGGLNSPSSFSQVSFDAGTGRVNVSTATAAAVATSGGRDKSYSLDNVNNSNINNSNINGNGNGMDANSSAVGSTTAAGNATPQVADGILALKVNPFSIKAFIKYFANDIIGVQYGIPKDCMAANLALTEALFFR